MTHQPNVLLLTIDTLRWDMLGCYGQSPSQTPHLDRLASSGIRFDQAITGGSWTQAAFPVIMTSTYASMYGGCLGPLAPARPSPVETLAAHGYNTAGFSTNPHLSRRTGYDRGFLAFTDLVPVEVDPRLRNLKGGQRLLRNSLIHYLLRPLGNPLRPARIYSSAADVTDSVCRWLDHTETPFFGWIHYMDLHWPYHLEEDLVHPSDIARAWQDLAIMYDRSNFNGNESIMTAQREHFIALYTRSLQYLDRQIGRLLSHVEKLGFAASTIVIAVSDHGEEFLDHGRWGHWESNLYEEILRVPLIIRLPGTAGGQVIRRQVSLLDTMPTILDLCGSTGAEGLLGTSLTPLWTERETEYNVGVVISEMQRDPWHRISVRTEHFKYIWDSNHPDEPHLYDLEADPLEKENVCAQHPHEAARLQAHVDTHLRRVAQTKPETALVQTEIDEDVARRLRDLGYVD